jgi:hypothetical protein
LRNDLGDLSRRDAIIKRGVEVMRKLDRMTAGDECGQVGL